MPDPLDHAIWEALTTSHADLAVTCGKARRYPAAVAPFAALQQPSSAALVDLADLLAPGEMTYLLGDTLPLTPQISWEATIPCLHMVFPTDCALPAGPSPKPVLHALTCTESAEMLALINVAYPGYFRPETCRMGRYFGIRDEYGTLIAMGGERLVAAPWREISALCVHPAQAGRGLGSILLAHLLALHRDEGSRSWLWVTEANEAAARLYRRVGFNTVRRSLLQRVQRVSVATR